MMIIQSKSTIFGVILFLLTLILTICLHINYNCCRQEESFETFSVEGQLISY
jgi:hypothetical protein